MRTFLEINKHIYMIILYLKTLWFYFYSRQYFTGCSKKSTAEHYEAEKRSWLKITGSIYSSNVYGNAVDYKTKYLDVNV